MRNRGGLSTEESGECYFGSAALLLSLDVLLQRLSCWMGERASTTWFRVFRWQDRFSTPLSNSQSFWNYELPCIRTERLDADVASDWLLCNIIMDEVLTLVIQDCLLRVRSSEIGGLAGLNPCHSTAFVK
jgi:hypothetical protein